MPVFNNQPSRPSGKGGGLLLQLTDVTPVIFFPLSSLQFSHDPRLGEDTESDDLGAHFSASGAPLCQGTVRFHRRDVNFPEALGLYPGQEIYRIWKVLGGLRVGVNSLPKAHMLFRCSLNVINETIEEIAPNMPIEWSFQGGTIYRYVNIQAVGVTPAALPALPAGS